MKYVAKLVIINEQGEHLLMYRSNHPAFGDDPDLPGGTLEEGESPLETMVREVEEEAGVVIDPVAARQLYAGTEYSGSGTHYSLYVAELTQTPDITMSWEHSKYEWLERATFITKAKSANDTYMHMVAEVFGQFDLI